MSKKCIQTSLLLFLIFFLRLVFGLSSKFWSVDELQIYRLGLSFYSDGRWPFFGPDVVYTGSKIPGALQALLVGLPFYILKIPESPYVFLNLLSFFSLSFFTFYLTKLYPVYPKWVLWSWVMFAPWTLIFSTHVINPSYVLPAAIIFWISFCETTYRKVLPIFTTKMNFFLMGVSLGWIYQLHMSWVILPPCILYVWLSNIKYRTAKNILYFIFGLLLFGSLALPTHLFQQAATDTASNIHFAPKNIFSFFQIFFRFLLFSIFFLIGSFGQGIQQRMAFFTSNWWVVPFYLATAIGALTQLCYVLLWCFSKYRSKDMSESKKIFNLIFAIILLTTGLFIFSIKAPSAHAFYLLLPLSFIFMAQIFQSVRNFERFLQIYLVLLGCNLIVMCTLMCNNFENRSLYSDRHRIERALDELSPDILTEKRL